MEAYRLLSAGIPISCLKQHQSSLGSQPSVARTREKIRVEWKGKRDEYTCHVIETVFQVCLLDLQDFIMPVSFSSGDYASVFIGKYIYIIGSRGYARGWEWGGGDGSGEGGNTCDMIQSNEYFCLLKYLFLKAGKLNLVQTE